MLTYSGNKPEAEFTVDCDAPIKICKVTMFLAVPCFSMVVVSSIISAGSWSSVLQAGSHSEDQRYRGVFFIALHGHQVQLSVGLS